MQLLFDKYLKILASSNFKISCIKKNNNTKILKDENKIDKRINKLTIKINEETTKITW